MCSVAGCKNLHDSARKGMCNAHYRQWKKYGDPTARVIRASGTGSRRTDGYLMHESGGRAVLNHVLVAERALGKRLPKGAQVHHVDYDRGNDANSNLVICPNYAYHRLLHIRTDALNACGNANWIKCGICGKYDAPEKIRIYRPSGNKGHPECFKARREGSA